MKHNEKPSVYYQPVAKQGLWGAFTFLCVAVILMTIVTPNKALCAAYIPLPLIVLLRIISVKGAARFDKAGIHVLKSRDEELFAITWDKVYSLHYIKGPDSRKVSYLMLGLTEGITSLNAHFEYRAYPTSEQISRYRFDENVRALISGSVSELSFRSQALYLFGMDEKTYKEIQRLWRSSRAGSSVSPL